MYKIFLSAPKFAEHAIGLRLAAAAVQVHDLPLRRENDLPAGRSQAPAQVGLLRIQKERLIKVSDLLQRVAPSQEAGANHKLHIALSIMRPGAIVSDLRMLRPARGQQQILA